MALIWAYKSVADDGLLLAVVGEAVAVLGGQVRNVGVARVLVLILVFIHVVVLILKVVRKTLDFSGSVLIAALNDSVIISRNWISGPLQIRSPIFASRLLNLSS